eukprot:SAG25_NODE_6331_length_569_cov_0.546809_1_plen_53_part_10
MYLNCTLIISKSWTNLCTLLLLLLVVREARCLQFGTVLAHLLGQHLLRDHGMG